jgi:hypothetical protein
MYRPPNSDVEEHPDKADRIRMRYRVPRRFEDYPM